MDEKSVFDRKKTREEGADASRENPRSAGVKKGKGKSARDERNA